MIEGFSTIYGNINEGSDLPYYICPIHTQEAYEEQQDPTEPEGGIIFGGEDDGGNLFAPPVDNSGNGGNVQTLLPLESLVNNGGEQ